MKCNVPVAEAINDEAVFPERVQEALGQLVGAAREGLLALSVQVGLGVLGELLEQEVDEIVGPKGKHNPGRAAVRHGHEDGEVTLGGRRVAVERPRVCPRASSRCRATGSRSRTTAWIRSTRRSSTRSQAVAVHRGLRRAGRAGLGGDALRHDVHRHAAAGRSGLGAHGQFGAQCPPVHARARGRHQGKAGEPARGDPLGGADRRHAYVEHGAGAGGPGVGAGPADG